MPSLISVTKLNGEKEPFSVKKVYDSALRAGASSSLARKIAHIVENEAYQGINTADIFKRVKQELKKENPQFALRFNLKEGIRKLGPAGFAFEKYVKEILINYGFEVGIDKILNGRCVEHETDFIASRNGEVHIGECKYRNNKGDKIDLNVCLKGFAVLEDIKAAGHFKNYSKIDFLIVTNSKFTNQAIKYSKCQGINLLGWKYPDNEGLESMIDRRKLYPITIIPSLKGHFMDAFSGEGMMLADDLLSLDIEKFSRKANIPRGQIERLVEEAKILFGYNN